MTGASNSIVRRFPESVRQAWVLGLLLILFSVAMFVTEIVANLGEPWNTVLRDIASAIFTTGGVAVVYELTLKATFALELMRLVHLRDEVSRAGFIRVVEPNRVQWSDVLSGASQYRLLIANPNLRWDWQDLLTAARAKKVDVSFYLPDPDCPSADTLAHSVGMSVDALRYAVVDLLARLEATWKADRDAGHLADGSRLSVHYYDTPCRYELISTDSITVILLGAAVGSLTRETPRAFWFAPADNGAPSQWVIAQFNELSGNALLKFVGDHRRSALPIDARAGDDGP